MSLRGCLRERGRRLDLQLAPVLFVCASVLLHLAAAKPQVRRLLWPLQVNSIPLSTPSVASLEPPEFGTELTKLGLAGFKAYLNSTLPLELEIDEQFAREFHESDHSRVNIAFLRWQKRVFAEKYNVPAEGLTSRMERIPRLEGIQYTWDELYNNAAFKQLRRRISALSRVYLKRSGHAAEELPKKFRIFTWVEVFRRGDSLRPWARTDGSYLMGRYFPTVVHKSMNLNFEDPRGINPPFGKTHSHEVFEGNLVLFPSWASHFITPNMVNKTAVCFAFLVYPPDGPTLDFEDDQTGSLVITSKVEPRSRGN
ncbi:unnamed protein product [Polarella glacialis]|uniref:Uncharacterized protein n=1 Tax=Polarella glacialis TaxID=89957 RepID=A0A813ED20_POLGL|nr:unnamed protein product [Polarella glacialis]